MQRLLAFVLACAARAEEPVMHQARQLFQKYEQLGRSFDAGLTELYADNAVIRNKRVYPSGEAREMSISGIQYKALIRKAMPVARASGDTNIYTQLSFTSEGRGVRIKGIRFSEMKKYESPISLRVEPSASGQWLITEEITESRP